VRGGLAQYSNLSLLFRAYKVGRQYILRVHNAILHIPCPFLARHLVGLNCALPRLRRAQGFGLYRLRQAHDGS
jgi:hypothetical protein